MTTDTKGIKRPREEDQQEGLLPEDNPPQNAARATIDDEDDAPLSKNYRLGKSVRKGAECPYLDSISRQV